MGSQQIGYICRFNPDAWARRDAPNAYFKSRAIEKDGVVGIHPTEDEEELGPLELDTSDGFFNLIRNFELAIIDGAARDLISRPDFTNDKMSVFFVGSETWGNTPDGYGYRIIDKIYKYGIEDYFALD